ESDKAPAPSSTAPEAAAPAAEPAPAPSPAEVAIKEPAIEPVESKRQRVSTPPISSGPRLQRVTVGPDKVMEAEDLEVASDDGDKPVRKGWWQRKLLGSDG